MENYVQQIVNMNIGISIQKLVVNIVHKLIIVKMFKIKTNYYNMLI